MESVIFHCVSVAAAMHMRLIKGDYNRINRMREMYIARLVEYINISAKHLNVIIRYNVALVKGDNNIQNGRAQLFKNVYQNIFIFKIK